MEHLGIDNQTKRNGVLRWPMCKIPPTNHRKNNSKLEKALPLSGRATKKKKGGGLTFH